MPNDPLHGITLEKILTRLVEHYGWKQLGSIITIKCFNNDPSITSSLTFLRRTPWARKKVEDLYVRYITATGNSEEDPPSVTNTGASRTATIDAKAKRTR
jgi:uncharacterized protein (DUF2132 family)